jgi:hypothetical protein
LVIFSTDVVKEEVPKPQPTPTPVASKVGIFSILPAVKILPINPTPRTTLNTTLQVIDYADPSSPFQCPSASLPGKLENIAEWDRSAGLVFTSRSNSTGGLTLDALLFEAKDQVPDLPGARGIDAGRRFIQDHQTRSMQQGLCKSFHQRSKTHLDVQVTRSQRGGELGRLR